MHEKTFFEMLDAAGSQGLQQLLDNTWHACFFLSGREVEGPLLVKGAKTLRGPRFSFFFLC